MTEHRRSLIAYLIALAGSAASLAFALGLRQADLTRPLAYGNDAVCMQVWVKGLIENGWYLTNPSLGAPGRMEMHDFPLSDSLHFLGLKLFTLVSSNYAVVLNGYYLATFFLVTLSAMAVLREFGVSRTLAVLASLLYAFLPYHQIRGERHLLLASYYLVPLATMLCLWLLRDGEVVFRETPDGGVGRRVAIRWRRAGVGLLIAVMLGSGGVYYAFFTCYLLAVAGTVGLNLAPKLLHERANGPNPAAVRRHVEDFDGLKASRMVLPILGHRIAGFDRVARPVDQAIDTRRWEYATTALGLVGTAGFLLLIAVFLVGIRRRAPGGLLGSLALLNLAAMALATPDGIGTLFCFYVTPLIRCYNRMVVFVGFFAFAGLAAALGRWERSLRSGPRRALAVAGLSGLTVLGILDQTSNLESADYARAARGFDADAEFVGRLEAALPNGAMVFELPLTEFPEGHAANRMGMYDLARPYLHSKALRWSFGAMKGRETDAWQKHVRDQPPAEMLRTLALAGFEAITIDRLGYADGGATVEPEIARVAGSGPIASGDGRLVAYPLARMATALRREMGEAPWARASAEALSPVVAHWGAGFHGREEGTDGLAWSWSDGRGTIRLSNPGPTPRAVELTMALGTYSARPTTVRIEGPDGGLTFPADPSRPALKTALIVPPGGTTLRLLSDGERARAPGDHRALVFSVSRFRVRPLDPDADDPAPVVATYPRGFHPEERDADGRPFRWSDGPGRVVLDNRWLTRRRVSLGMDLLSLRPEGSTVRVEGPDVAASYRADGEPRRHETTLTLPPGPTTIQLNGDGRAATVAGDPRTLAYRLSGLEIVGIDEPEDSRPVTARIGEGFYPREERPDGYWWRWSSGRGEIRLRNNSDQSRRVDLTMSLATFATDRAMVRVEGPGLSAAYPADPAGREMRAEMVVPPGSSTLRLSCDGERARPPGDDRTLTFRVAGLRLDDAGTSARR